jgi:hypothetical protein
MRAAWVAVFVAIHRYQNTSGVTAKELCGYAFPVAQGTPPDTELEAALSTLITLTKTERRASHILGNKLRSKRDSIVNVPIDAKPVSLKLTADEGRGGILRWRVYPV